MYECLGKVLGRYGVATLLASTDFFQKTVFCRIRANVFREMKNTLLVLPSRKEMMMVGNSSGHVKFLFPLVILLFFFF